jgi:hypothetical protein
MVRGGERSEQPHDGPEMGPIPNTVIFSDEDDGWITSQAAAPLPLGPGDGVSVAGAPSSGGGE